MVKKIIFATLTVGLLITFGFQTRKPQYLIVDGFYKVHTFPKGLDSKWYYWNGKMTEIILDRNTLLQRASNDGWELVSSHAAPYGSIYANIETYIFKK